jgi:arginase
MIVEMIGVPLDFGAGRRGVDMGPSAIRYAGLQAGLEALGLRVIDRGNVQVPIQETCRVSDPRLRYIDCIVPVTRRVMGKTAGAARLGHIPITLGGDHSLSLGSVRGVARHKPLGLIWIDAHGDFNTHLTTPSGNIHGMPLAALAGLGDPRLVHLSLSGEAGPASPGPAVRPENMVVIGARDLDPGERDLLRQAGVQVFAMEQIDRLSLPEVMQRAVHAASRDTQGIYLSFDLDVIDPIYAPGVGTAVQGGLTYREAHLACEIIAESGLLAGMDLVEVNPILDVRNQTAALAVELICSALGKRVY